MDKKTNEIYNKLLIYIKENIFDLDLDLDLDYEQGLRKAVNLVFPRAKLVGCWYVCIY